MKKMLNSLTIFLFYLNSSLINLSDAAVNLLIMASNKYQSHFSFHKKLALLLKEQEWVESVNVLLPLLNPYDEDLEEIASYSSKLKTHYYTLNMEGERINLSNHSNNRETQNTFLNFLQPPICIQHCIEGLTTIFGLHRNQQDQNIVDDSTHPLKARYENIFFDMAKNKTWIESMQTQQFQLAIAELFDPMAFYIFSLIGIPHLVATSALPIQSIYYHYLGYLEKMIEKGDIPELCSTRCNTHFLHNFELNHCNHVCNGLKMFNEYDEEFEKIFQHYNEFPEKFEQIFKEKTPLIFVNQQKFVDFDMPEDYPEKIINIGGITISEDEQSLSHMESVALKKAVDKYGLIYFCFGTIININKNVSEEGIYNIMNTFHSLNASFEVLFASEWTDYLRNLKNHRFGYELKNVHIKQRMNQLAILAHERTKIFISHCGINSVLEAIKNGVLLICVPFFADQFYNSEALAKRGVAIVLDKNNNFADLEDKLIEIANDLIYEHNMKALQAIFNYANPKETFLGKMEELVLSFENNKN